MSKLNVNRNVFLEKEELSNFQSFLSGGIVLQALLQASYSFGLVTNNPSKINEGWTAEEPLMGFNDPFVVEQGTANGSIKVLPGIAVTSQGNFIRINVEDNIAVPNDSLYYWVKIAYTTRNYELGYVSVNNQGVVSGTTDFSNKVRGQSTNTPVCIRFEKQDGSVPLNNGIYQIVNVIDSQNLMLSSATTFVTENNLRPVILGTLPLGGVFSKEQRDGLYTYDYYTITLVSEVSVATPPEKGVDEYYISRIQNSGGNVLIDNTVKNEFWSLGNIFLGTKTT